VLTTGLTNTNPVYHCPASLLNFSGIERGIVQPFHELVTASIARVMDVVDKERLALGGALGVRLDSWWSFLARTYAADHGDPVERVHTAARKRPFPAPTSPTHRYLTEDIPFGLVPWASIAREIGVPTPATDALIDIANTLYGQDMRQDGRTVESLGLKGLTAPQIRQRFVAGI
jgi:opine dehydrogenase